MTKLRCGECGKSLIKTKSFRVTKQKKDDLKSIEVKVICKDCVILLGLDENYIIKAID